MQPNAFMFIAYQNKMTVEIKNAKIYTDNMSTNASGGITFSLYPNFFATIHSVHADVVRDTTDPTKAVFAMVRSANKDQVVVQVFESKTTGILVGGSVEGLEPAGSGLTVYLTVIGL